MAMESPTVSMAPTRVTRTNAGSSVQKAGPKSRSNPGHPPSGNPIHAASATRPKSYMPNAPPTAEPTTTPMTGAQSRQTPVAASAIATMTAMVTPADTGAASAGAPSGALSSMSKIIGMTVTAISMMTVPATDGVKMRRTSDRRAASANWKKDEMTTSVASSAGPPCAMAPMHTAMKAPEVPISRT